MVPSRDTDVNEYTVSFISAHFLSDEVCKLNDSSMLYFSAKLRSFRAPISVVHKGSANFSCEVKGRVEIRPSSQVACLPHWNSNARCNLSVNDRNYFTTTSWLILAVKKSESPRRARHNGSWLPFNLPRDSEDVATTSAGNNRVTGIRVPRLSAD